MKIGDKILIVTDMADPSSLREYTVSKVNKYTVQCNNNSEMTCYTAFCWPIEVKDELLTILQERARLKALYDDSMELIY